MRNVVLSLTMTLDGFFCGPGGELDWMSQTPDQELNADMVAFLQSIDQGFIGYPTACGMLPYWLAVAQNPAASPAERATAQAVNRLRPIIISRQAETLAWEQAELLVVQGDEDLVAAVTRIRQQPGRDLGVPGGIRTAQTFVRLGLIDRYMLTIHPVAIGAGRRIFSSRVRLQVLSTRHYNSGVCRVWYRPADRI